MSTDPPTGFRIKESDSLLLWKLELTATQGSIYESEVFQLEFTFGDQYPMEAPIVVFKPPAVPLHPHIYSNGHICLSILYDQWSPALTVASICLSIQSMLNSCTKKELPPSNDSYVKTAPKNPKKVNWAFHDDSV